MTYYWLSFTDPERPEGQRFLGGCIVEAENFLAATTRAWKLGISPGVEGSEVAGIAIAPEYEANIGRFGVDRLISKAELNALGEFSEYDRERNNG